jgi:signal transduction histidine kinase
MREPEAVVPLLRLRLTFDSTFDAARRPVSLTPALRTLLIALLTAISYFIGSQIGFRLTPAYTPISTFWPPNAIFLAILLLTPARIWWVLVLAVLPAHLLIQLRTGVPLITAVGWFAGNVGEAFLGAACIRLFNKDRSLFKSVDGVLAFLAFGVLLPTFVTSFLDACGVILTGLGQSFWTLWTERLTSNIVSDLAIVPIIVILGSNGISWLRRLNLLRYIETAVLAVAVVGVSVLVFGRESAAIGIPALVYVPLTVLFWAAVRFGCGGLSASLLAMAVISLVNTIHGRGPLGMQGPVNAVISLRILLIVYAVPLMCMAALFAERERNQQTLKITRGKLIRAQEQECHRIAQELHTDIIGQLTMAELRVDQFRSTSSSLMRPILDHIHGELAGICKDILDLTHTVHPFMVEYLGLANALKNLCDHTGEESGMTISFSTENVPLSLPAEISQRLFRITRKALQNASQRRANEATVALRASGGRLLLRIADDGIAAPERAEDTGLSWMREQLLSLDGKLEIKPSPSGGLIVDAAVPISGH